MVLILRVKQKAAVRFKVSVIECFLNTWCILGSSWPTQGEAEELLAQLNTLLLLTWKRGTECHLCEELVHSYPETVRQTLPLGISILHIPNNVSSVQST